MAYVYKHLRKDTNEIFYIGIGKTIKRLNSKGNRNQYWHNIVNKAGFDVEIVEDGLSWEDACEREKYWIKYYGRRDLNEGTLVNMTNGGEGVVGHSDEVLRKISNASKNRIISDETREKLKNRIVTDETREKLSKSLKGRKLSDEHINKIKKSNKNCIPPSRKGKTLSDEAKTKLSKINTGKVLSDETKNKIKSALLNRTDDVKKKQSDGIKAWWKRRKEGI